MAGEVTLHNYCEGNDACPPDSIMPDTSTLQLYEKVTNPCVKRWSSFPTCEIVAHFLGPSSCPFIRDYFTLLYT
jgi:hypothetical protein